ncbi:MAG: ZIP family metal transporter [Cyclobacteriaceae bacterium]|nr:ZIP family metal transporter [Cyclobacteriaceae bacterium]
MLLNGLILLLVTFIAGFISYRINLVRQRDIKHFLVFAGGFLFSITVVHILPELYLENGGGLDIGIFVLAGFFLQQVLEFSSHGVEHGHFHHISESHRHRISSGLMVVVSLSFHAFFEGSILVHDQLGNNTILIGILLHKVPATFALVSMLTCCFTNRSIILGLLFLFSMASPLGILAGNMVDQEFYKYIFAIVSGSFLHISTTIVFESSTEHKFSLRKMLWALTGATMAIIADMFVL